MLVHTPELYACSQALRYPKLISMFWNYAHVTSQLRAQPPIAQALTCVHILC